MMRTNIAIAFIVLNLCSATTRAEVTFEWATVGNPGNGPDDTGFGSVPYVYRISKHEVTNAQYTEFLNAVDPTGANTLDLYDSRMTIDTSSFHPLSDIHITGMAVGGIDFVAGAENGSKYQVKDGRHNNPVSYVSFFDAMRFTNWLQNGQGSGSTESGAYKIGDGIRDIRNPGATYFIPSENEWYKAAYHKNDGVTANYWDYPTSTDDVPYSDEPPGNNAPSQSNTANYFNDDGVPNGFNGGFAVTGRGYYRDFDPSLNYLTDVGAYTTSVSPYGTFDQGGNVREWNEAAFLCGSGCRGVRGGWWGTESFLEMAPLQRGNMEPYQNAEMVGFRVASSIPEPSTGLLGLLSAGGLLLKRRQQTVTFKGKG
jgi:formylglycine-generating enzyme required for sulfatase activity